MTRRITIARDGTVRLNGRATRWEAGWVDLKLWGVWRPNGERSFGGTLAAARAYLATLTDEELRG